MLARRFNSPLTSSAGRLFDAVASIAGVRDSVSYEGQAAVELEWLATNAEPDTHYPFEVTLPGDTTKPGVIDTRPLIRAVAEDAKHGVGAARISRRFHTTLVEIITDVCRHIARETGLKAVVVSGGVFLNALLTSEVQQSLSQAGLRVYRHRLVPPNDGGLSLGQLAIAAASASHCSTLKE
jgi:hydrogenase maturation protein HypF